MVVILDKWGSEKMSLCVLCENKKCPNIEISWNCIKFYSSLKKERGKRIKMNPIDDYKGNIEAVKKI